MASIGRNESALVRNATLLTLFTFFLYLQRIFTSGSAQTSNRQCEEYAKATRICTEPITWTSYSIRFFLSLSSPPLPCHSLSFYGYVQWLIEDIVCNIFVVFVTEENRTAKEAEVSLLMDEVERAQSRLLSLEREKVKSKYFVLHFIKWVQMLEFL